MKKIETNSSVNKLNKKEIIATVKEAALTCYGVSSVQIEINKKGQEEIAIIVHDEKEGKFSLDIHVNVVEGVKVTETIRSLQKTIRFYMNRLYPHSCLKINIFAEGISSVE